MDHPFDCAKEVYILYKSPAKILASSPPVPALISITAFFESSGSFGINKTLISSSKGFTLGKFSSNSIFAISFISASLELAIISFASSIFDNSVLYVLYIFIIGSRSLYSLLNCT